MDSAGFDAARWDHWLLLVGFITVACCGLRLSYLWRKDLWKKERLAKVWQVKVRQMKVRQMKVRSRQRSMATYHSEIDSKGDYSNLTTNDLSRHVTDRDRTDRDSAVNFNRPDLKVNRSKRYTPARRRGKYPIRIK